jgi:hypothetical protein
MLEALNMNSLNARATKRLFVLMSIVSAAAISNAASAQSRTKLIQSTVMIETASGISLGRGVGSSALYVQHRVEYCLRNTSSVATGGTLSVEFTSKGLVRRKGGVDLVRGQLNMFEEALGARERRCGSIDFEIHADAVVGLSLFSEGVGSQLVVRSEGVTVLDSQPVAPKQQRR